MPIYTESGIQAIAYRGTAVLPDPGKDLYWIGGLNFRTGYPGGLFLDGDFELQHDLADFWAVQGLDRIVFYEGRNVVYEGRLVEMERVYGQGADEYILAHLAGDFATTLMKERLAKPWVTNLVDEDTWRWQTDTTIYLLAEKCETDRRNRVRFTPKAVACGNGDFGAVRATAPSGQTWKKIVYDYDLQEAAQQWEIAVYRSTNGTSWTLVASANGDTISGSSTTTTVVGASGTGSLTATFGTPSRYIELRFYSRAAQTPASDGTIYGQYKNIKLYTETSAINATEVAKDIIGAFSSKFNSLDEYIQSCTLDLEPFIAEDDTLADILADAVRRGDASNNRWAFGLRESELARTPNGLPVLFLEPYPDPEAGYDLVINRQSEDDDIAGEISISKDYTRIANDIIVRWSDEAGFEQRLTSTEDATLKDQTSIDRWGRQVGLVTLDYSTQAMAVANARRILATYKDPLNIAQSIKLRGYVRTGDGDTIHVSRVRAGLRLMVEDVIDELTGAAVTLVITGQSYEDDADTATLTFGQTIDPILTILARPVQEVEEVEQESDGGGEVGDMDSGDAGGGGEIGVTGEPGRLNFYKTKIWKKALKLGLATQDQFKKLSAQEKKKLKKAVRKKLG